MLHEYSSSEMCKKLYTINVPFSVTVAGVLDGPLNPQILLLTLNVQFLAVVDSCKLGQVAEVLFVTLGGQLPQSEVIEY